MKKNVALVLIGVVLGVTAGALATGRVRAQAAPAAAPMARWEQDCAEARGVEDVRAVVRARGEAGWELVAFDAGILCFKRPVPPPPKPQEPWPGY